MNAAAMPRRPLLALAFALLLPGCDRPAALRIETSPDGDRMVALPGGTFAMGSDDGDADERPVRRVTVGPFLIDFCEVTQELLQRLGVSDPSPHRAPGMPAHNLTWVQAAEICNARSRRDGLEPCYDEATARCDFARNGYRLPTEAEWEYACRAGSTAAWSCGSDPGRLRDHAWFAANGDGRPHPVGTRRPNAFGLHDMHGNVAEWCNDVYDPAAYAAGPATDPRGPVDGGVEGDGDADGEACVVRGGSYASSPAQLRAAARARERPGFGDACLAPGTLGMRCVRSLPPAGD